MELYINCYIMSRRHFSLVTKRNDISYQSIIRAVLCLYQKKVPKTIHKLIFSFLAINQPYTLGRYSGMRPKQSANKIASGLIQKMAMNDIKYNSIIYTILCLNNKNIPHNIHMIIFTFLSTKLNKKLSCRFAIKEVTRNSRKKIYNYKVIREKLDEPTEVHLSNGKIISYKYANSVKKINL